MNETALLNDLRLRLPDAADASDELLLSLLRDAGSLICALTWREEIPPALSSAQIRMAVIFFNRMGMEGEKEHTEGDIRRSAEDLPESLRREIFSYRKAST